MVQVTHNAVGGGVTIPARLEHKLDLSG